VQAQDADAAALSVRARRAGLVAADVERARVQERSIVRTWCMRGTLHLVAAEDLGWLLGLLGPVFVKSSQRRGAELGLDEDTGARAIRALRDVLGEHGPLTRDEIAERLTSRGISLIGQAKPHILRLAALQGTVCLGPNRGREPTYVLVADWVNPGPALSSEKAGAKLAHRYLSAYAPATPEDFAAWSGLTLNAARAAWQHISNRLTEVKTQRLPAWILKTQAARLKEPVAAHPVVRLLPRYDTYLLGYRSRDLVVAAEHSKSVAPGGGVLHPTLLVDGRVAGTWKVKRHRDGMQVVVEPFEDLTMDVLCWLQMEVEDLAHFLSTKALLKVKQ